MCKGTTYFPWTTICLPTSSYPSAIISNLGDHPAPHTIISTCDISSQLIACGRTASPSLVTAARGLVLYMDTSIYTFHADQGSLESISKDFPCVRYVVL